VAKKGSVNFIIKKNDQGEIELLWKVIFVPSQGDLQSQALWKWAC